MLPETKNQEEASSLEKPEVERPVLKRKGASRKIASTIFVLLLLFVGAAVLGVYTVDKRVNQANDFDQQIFKISKGDTLRSFVDQLQSKGIVSEPYSTVAYARYKKLGGKLHTGHYQFDDGLSLVEVLDSITSGKHQLTHTFKFVQGSTFKQLLKSIRESKTLVQTLGDKSGQEILKLIDPQTKHAHPEGLFFPETYAFSPGETDFQLLKRAYKAMQATLDELWKGRSEKTQISTPYEALIMASIIEKETGLASERPIISGVFDNRLVKGMRLQTDPTVIYGIGDKYDGNITRAHLKTDTPYNTYTRYGLTPTPICFPGRAAIKAALNPAKTDAIYFVARGDGSRGHKFSKTLTEHNKAVKQYLKNIKKRG